MTVLATERWVSETHRLTQRIITISTPELTSADRALDLGQVCADYLRGRDTGFVTRSCFSAFGNQPPWFPAAVPFRVLIPLPLLKITGAEEIQAAPRSFFICVDQAPVCFHPHTQALDGTRAADCWGGGVLVICLPGKQPLFPIDSICLHAESI